MACMSILVSIEHSSKTRRDVPVRDGAKKIITSMFCLAMKQCAGSNGT